MVTKDAFERELIIEQAELDDHRRRVKELLTGMDWI